MHPVSKFMAGRESLSASWGSRIDCNYCIVSVSNDSSCTSGQGSVLDYRAAMEGYGLNIDI